MAEKTGIPIPEVREENLDTSTVDEGVDKSRTAFLPKNEVKRHCTCLSVRHLHTSTFTVLPLWTRINEMNEIYLVLVRGEQS